ncbi:MAG TPA: hypothetical protein DCY13_20370 [Verrucomicrobiales bacterium]|nr:hypothetical protein [Verrucomicrobiales bacterium]
MKNIKSTFLALGLAAATSFFLAGCGEGDHAGHDHDHDGAGHDHASETGKAATDAAGKLADAAGSAVALAIVEKPTAEQLAAAKPYTLETCLVSDEKLGEMGEPLVLVVGNQQVKLCCDHCLPDLKKDAAKLVAKLNK